MLKHLSACCAGFAALLAWAEAPAAALPESLALPPSMSSADHDYREWSAERSAEWRDAFDETSPACRAFIAAEVPPASSAWCRAASSPEHRAIAAAPELLWVAVGSNSPKQATGLSALHALVNDPDALKPDGSERTFRDQVFAIIGESLHQSAIGMDDIDAMIGRIEELCVRLAVSTGESEQLATGVTRTSTRACILASALLELERTGSIRPSLAPRSQAWEDVALQAKYGEALLREQQHLLEVLENNVGERGRSSLLLMREFATRRLQRCSRFISRSEDRGCPIP